MPVVVDDKGQVVIGHGRVWPGAEWPLG